MGFGFWVQGSGFRVQGLGGSGFAFKYKPAEGTASSRFLSPEEFRGGSGKLGPGAGPFFHFWGLGFPYNPLKTEKGALFIPRLLPGLGSQGRCCFTEKRAALRRYTGPPEGLEYGFGGFCMMNT